MLLTRRYFCVYASLVRGVENLLGPQYRQNISTQKEKKWLCIEEVNRCWKDGCMDTIGGGFASFLYKECPILFLQQDNED